MVEICLITPVLFPRRDLHLPVQLGRRPHVGLHPHVCVLQVHARGLLHHDCHHRSDHHRGLRHVPAAPQVSVRGGCLDRVALWLVYLMAVLICELNQCFETHAHMIKKIYLHACPG